MAGDASMFDVIWGGDYFSTEELVMLQDDDMPINNKAESYLDPIVEKWSYSTLTLSYYTTSIDVSRRAGLVNSINDASLWQFGTYELLLHKWYFEMRWGRDDALFIYNDLEFLVNSKGWQRVVPNVGPVRIASAGAQLPEDRYQTIDAKNADGSLIPSDRYVLTSTGAWKANQTSALAGGEKLTFKTRPEADLKEIFPGDTAPTMPTALSTHPS
jgi:hypothetical protein